ncbi:DNA repair protein RecO [Verrucomicrobiota bacterium]
MIVKATAIPLGITPFGNTSHIVHWLTREYGRVNTIIKGAQRPKSGFIGQYDFFDTTELLFYARNKEGIMTTKECYRLIHRAEFHNSWRHGLAASYITRVIRSVMPDFLDASEVFDFYEEMLNLAQEYGDAETFIFWFELQMLEYQGHTPQLNHCGVCGKPFNKLTDRLRFSSAQGGLVEASCAQFREIPALPLDKDVLSIIRMLQQAKTPRSTHKLTERQLNQLSHLLGHFMAHHLNIDPAIRQIARTSLETNVY